MTDDRVSPATPGLRPIHRLLLLRYGIDPRQVLNDANGGKRPASDVLSSDLLRLVNALKGEAIAEDGRRVDYGRLRASRTYAEYRDCASELPAFDPGSLVSREQRLAFWINLYNALIVDAVIRLDVRESVQDVPGFFWKAAYNVGGLRYSAFDMEYGILRANAAHPAIPGAHFGSQDPRRRFALQALDPRIHFALVCAARSCPPISVYTPEEIDAQLDLAARSFVNGGGVEIDRDAGEVRLSRIFQWYAPDFGAFPLALVGKRSLLSYITTYVMDPQDRAYLLQGTPRVRFMTYDWSLNVGPLG